MSYALKYDFYQDLPRAEELPDSDNKPVDNDLQYLVPTLLRSTLQTHWQDRQDWFFGINMGIYHTSGGDPRTPIVPDGFLCLGVNPPANPVEGRLSYIVWLENNIVPTLVLECVSKTYGGEYDDKLTTYARMGVSSYVIYNPHHHRRLQRAPLEIYRLVKGRYKRQPGFRAWLPEVGLGIGRESGIVEHWERDWLYWYDAAWNRLPIPVEQVRQERYRAKQAEQQAEQAKQRAEQAEQRASEAEQRAEQERRRAETAEAELAHLRALLGQPSRRTLKP